MRILLLVCLSITAQAATVMRIACGGSGGAGWQPDAYFTGGARWTNDPPAGLVTPYLNLRYATSFSYSIPLPAGQYSVTLKFIEPNKTGPGQRLFGVSINGGQVTSGLDLFAAAGALKPYDLSFPATSAGYLKIDITATLGNAVLSGIQVDSVDQPPSGTVNYGCAGGLGDGIAPFPTNGVFTSETKYRYSQNTCFNDTGGQLRVLQIRCFSDNAEGNSTLDVMNGAGVSLLASPIVCGPKWVIGTQSSVTTLDAEDWIQFLFIPDGATTQTTWVVTMKR